MKLRNGNRIVAWRPQMLIPAVASILLLQGCDYALEMGHLKDNPMDQAIDTLIEADHMRETRDRILKRFPIGRPAAQLRQYLESVGSRCKEASGKGIAAICRYKQHQDTVFRTPFGRSRENRRIYDFRIELLQRRGLLSDVRVCRRIIIVRYRGTITDYSERIELPIKCLDGRHKKGK